LAHATSYCDTDALLFEFCGWVPAYFESAVPPEKAEPGALPEPPGGVPVVSHDCIGWPVVWAGPLPGLAGGAVVVVGAIVVGPCDVEGAD
jgi:hypothetical protein